MAEPTSTTDSNIVATEIQQKRPHTEEAALLLTPAPIEALRRELDLVSELGPHYYAINTGIRMELRDDSHANQLRATLMNINEPMDSVSDKLTLALVKAHNFYAHKWKVTSEGGGSTHVTKELASKLLEPEFQASAIKKAREAATQAAEAAKVVREDVIPLLPRLEADLENYLLDYMDRTTAIEERRRSWIPSFFLNLIWGPVDPTPWHLNEVQGLQHRLSAANYQLRRLPAFFDNLELHFKRLSELSSEKLPGLGYTTSDDLIRLYQDRIKCDQILRHMDNSWYSAGRAFAFGALKNLP